ncbi:hypothetical protein SDC9_72152 [bioreactor metagenome]|uniref:Uncharacterized protein n=1 Tax=bioreactor metagenome TaxID=1076179 RepID=A0A644YHS3_9ZZZZ
MIGGVEAGPICLPENLILRFDARSLVHGMENLALLYRQGCAVSFAVMNELVHVSAQYFVYGVKTENLKRAAIAECTLPLQIDPIDGFSCGVEQQLKLQGVLFQASVCLMQCLGSLLHLLFKVVDQQLHRIGNVIETVGNRPDFIILGDVHSFGKVSCSQCF